MHQLGILGVLLITSKGAAGVSGAAFIVLAATLSSLGTIPVASITLILGIHRFMVEAISMTNLVGICRRNNCLLRSGKGRWMRRR
jgi:aerobic C4-dicarboxylate transport protein